MRGRYLEVTFRKGRAIAAYLYLPRRGAERAARVSKASPGLLIDYNANGKAILYADRVTDSMGRAIEETQRRRAIQEEFNREHGITPRTIVKPIEATLVTAYEADYFKVPLNLEEFEEYTKDKIESTIHRLEMEMREAAKRFEFERAAELRDRVKYLRDRELQIS